MSKVLSSKRMAPVKEGEELFAAVRSFSNKMVDALVMTSLVTETGGLGATAGLLRRTI
jgi:hypothetical protein